MILTLLDASVVVLTYRFNDFVLTLTITNFCLYCNVICMKTLTLTL